MALETSRVAASKIFYKPQG